MDKRYPDDEISSWCTAGNSVDELKKNPGKSLALVPCWEYECNLDLWEDGRCCQIERVGKHGRMELPSTPAAGNNPPLFCVRDNW
ncbi:MAG: hypothetical protein WCB46_05690 [Methanoregula sp.]